jgi:hypothetical protein
MAAFLAVQWSLGLGCPEFAGVEKEMTFGYRLCIQYHACAEI